MTVVPDAGTLVRGEGVTVTFPSPRGPVAVVDAVDFQIGTGRTTGVIGESGSGKTMLASAIIGLLPPTASLSGRIELRGRDVVGMAADERRKLRGHEISMIFQDPLSSLNPTQRIGKQIGEIARRDGVGKQQRAALVVDLMTQAGIPDAAARAQAYPHQFSGGLRQRAMIALALSGSPSLVLADEPTTALDVTVQARILHLLQDLQQRRGMSILLVSHDLRVMSHVSQDVVVMYCGRVCESGPTTEVLRRPAHPYTVALARSIPPVRTKAPLPEPLPGAPASPYARPPGCAFHPRCPLARDICRTQVPEPREVAPGRTASCHFATEVLG